MNQLEASLRQQGWIPIRELVGAADTSDAEYNDYVVWCDWLNTLPSPSYLN